MWFALPVAALVLLLIIGGILAGGIFTIVLVPIAVIAAGAAFLFALWNRSQSGSGGRSQAQQTGDPLPHSGHHNVAPSPATPNELVDAQQKQ